jgi:blue copper oxidase
MTLIGNDGGLLEQASTPSEILLGPAERLDLLLDLRGRAGTRVMLRCLSAGWDLLEFRVAPGSPVDGQPPPAGATLSTIRSLAQPVRTRDFSFDGMSRINGQVYDMHRTDFEVPFGQVERWRFATGSPPVGTRRIRSTSTVRTSRSSAAGATG